jgi:ABC-type polysaccharide/polyol phosphate transport system ATPase subunit
VTSSDAAVEVRGVSKKFRLYKERNRSLKATILRGRRVVSEDFWALREISFDVTRGETFGLIGENGSGKSTMLKCLAKILRPDSGKISVAGKVSALLELGAGFHPELSGRENVYLNGAILGLSQKELRRRFDGIVEFAGIEKFIDEPVRNYSSGMYVRLGFSVAINVDPDVLLVDEVLAVGDESFQRKCQEKFTELQAAGKTVVVVSHDMTSVETLCDRVAWFDHGDLREIGKAREVIQHYKNTVEVGQTVDEEGHERWGSGAGRIESVELLDADDRPVSRLRTGDRATLRLRYDMNVPIPRPVFAVAISTTDGVVVSGPSSRIANCVPEKLSGRGTVDLTFDALTLLPGTYDLSASLHDFDMIHVHDYRQNIRRFEVQAGTYDQGGGIVSLGGRWHIGDLVSRPVPPND